MVVPAHRPVFFGFSCSLFDALTGVILSSRLWFHQLPCLATKTLQRGPTVPRGWVFLFRKYPISPLIRLAHVLSGLLAISRLMMGHRQEVPHVGGRGLGSVVSGFPSTIQFHEPLDGFIVAACPREDRSQRIEE